ncbi:uncharacterized protein C8R40DRAFT_760604 [Lentinula edodes]|uniref:uncharacterized protein n=1 Tax=Lentinula edodes TaxID=5353 RepID=UPI001E8CADA1|nr:uncharacterized protein C8R40DRAFT_760604 [Lentinula edodes]KAH7878406.1 hypothetical protein C8R40DRAFT_760604 [Lentinula edodes]
MFCRSMNEIYEPSGSKEDAAPAEFDDGFKARGISFQYSSPTAVNSAHTYHFHALCVYMSKIKAVTMLSSSGDLQRIAPLNISMMNVAATLPIFRAFLVFAWFLRSSEDLRVISHVPQLSDCSASLGICLIQVIIARIWVYKVELLF